MDLVLLENKYSDLPYTWFEFLFNHSLIVKHLTLLETRPNAEPSACQMISSFMDKVSAETMQDSEPLYSPKLRELALYVAGWLKWNLAEIMTSVPFVSQVGLMEALKHHARIQPLLDFNLPGQSPADALGHVIFARWVARSATVFLSRSSKMPETAIANDEQMATVLSPLLPYAVHVLRSVGDGGLGTAAAAPSYPAMELPGVRPIGGDAVAAVGVQCQACFDLGQLLFQQGKFTEAGSLLQRAKDMAPQVPANDLFFSVDRKRLEADLLACLQVGEFPASALARSDGTQTAKVVTRVEQCRKHCMQGVDAVLLDGSASRSIPLPYRRDLEDGLAAAAYPGPRSFGQSSAAAATVAASAEAAELNWRVSACNAVHSVVLGLPVSPSFWLTWYQADSTEHVKLLLKICASYMQPASTGCNAALLGFARDVCQSSKHSNEYIGLLQHHELSANQGSRMTADSDSDQQAGGRHKIHAAAGGAYPWEDERSALNQECHLLSSTTVAETRSLLGDLQKRKSSLSPLGLSDWWSKDRHNNNLLSVLMVKARHLQQAKAFKDAEKVLLTAWDLAESVGPPGLKNDVLRRLSDSQLSLDITQWMTIQRNDLKRYHGLVRGTKDFLSKASSPTAVLTNPLLETCSVFLVNAKEWSAAADLLSRVDLAHTSKTVQLCHALMAATITILANQGKRGQARNLFDIVSDLLIQPTQYKRSSEGLKKEALQRAREAEAKRMLILKLAQRITEPTVLGVLVSCLVRVHTALVLHESGDGGESKSPLPLAVKVPEISCQYPLCWPVAVNSPSNMSRSQVLLILQQVLDHCVQQHGDHPSFLCTAADILMTSQHYTSALKLYLSLGAAHSNFFTSAIPPEVWPDHVYRSMIACCQSTKAFTQAAVLCQLVVPVDHSLANHCLQQTNCHDAMEYFYDCMWDLLILEVAVHTHSLRGEDEKKQVAINAITCPDLNEANSPELCRKAAQVRLSRFLRRMAAVYI